MSAIMIFTDAPEQFRQRLAARGLTLETLTPRAALDAMVSFYQEVRFEDCDLEGEGDMLLVQWMQWEEKGQPAAFFFDVTRQLTGTEQDADMWHLSLSFFFPADPALEALRHGSHWVSSPGHLADDPAQLDNLAAFRAVEHRTGARVTLVFDLQ